MYSIKFDLRDKKNGFYLKDKADVVIAIEDYNVEAEIKFDTFDFEKLFDEYKQNVGEDTYEELNYKVEKLEVENERLSNLIEQYEEYNDERIAKYFRSEFN